MEPNELLNEALKARNNLAYTPYSRFKVGAAVLTKDGRVFHGANIENAAYSLCMCAERNAIYNAYMAGCRKDDIVALACIGDTHDGISPCGACRQVMAELMPKKAAIYLGSIRPDVEVIETTIEELLPYAFDESDL